MTSEAHPLLSCIAKAKFAEASAELMTLSALARNAPASSAEILPLLRTARENALVQRAHLLKALEFLQSSKLFDREEERVAPTFSLEG